MSCAILEDMRKYYDNFDPNEYVEGPKTGESVIQTLRLYYEENLPVGVTAWIRVNEPNKKLIYGNQIGRQIVFVRDILGDILTDTSNEYEAFEPQVIATHTSKSVKLPIYQINLEKYGLEIVMKNNFFSWAISIKSENPLDFDMMELFDEKEVAPLYLCDGLPSEKIYGSYAQNHAEFTIEMKSEYKVYTLFYLIKNYLTKLKSKEEE